VVEGEVGGGGGVVGGGGGVKDKWCLRCPVRLSDSTSSFLQSKRRHSYSKLAHVHEQREFTYSAYL